MVVVVAEVCSDVAAVAGGSAQPGLVIKPHFLLHIAIIEALFREAGSSPRALSKLWMESWKTHSRKHSLRCRPDGRHGAKRWANSWGCRPNKMLLPQQTSGPLPQMPLVSFLSLSLIFVTQKENLLTRHSLLSLRGREGSSLSSHAPSNRLTQPGASLINTTTPQRWKPWETRAESGSVGRHRASEQRHRVHFLLWFYLSSRAGTGTWNMLFGSLHYLFLSAAAYKESHARSGKWNRHTWNLRSST